MKSKYFTVKQNERGAIVNLTINDDPSEMNWVIDPAYLKSLKYQDNDKLFGEFHITINGHQYVSINETPIIKSNESESRLSFLLGKVEIIEKFILRDDSLYWRIEMVNHGKEIMTINDFGVWISLAYVMFRDKNVHRNANQSAAVFPSISANYAKLAAVRRDNTNPNLGVYQTGGNVLSVGTYNDYTNRFFENVSPSLDGMLFHEFVLAGGYKSDKRPHHDWIYPQNEIDIQPNQTASWEFVIHAYSDRENFYRTAKQFGHPNISFEPLVQSGQKQLVTIIPADNQQIEQIIVKYKKGSELVSKDMTSDCHDNRLRFNPQGLGEHQLVVRFADGTSDMCVFNVMSSVNQLLATRADYICHQSYSGKDGKVPYSFGPVSNQGESIGKMTFVLQECLLDPHISNLGQKIGEIEESAVKYVRTKWFVDGNFKKPRKLYGDFYRVMDLEYIAHLFYLLSKCPAKYLTLHKPMDYLKWATEVFDVRVNPDLHDNQRGKEEAQMLGVYFMYIEDLLKDVKNAGLAHEYKEISRSWQTATKRVEADSDTLAAAMTEHFFDNAGFGPAAAALALTNNQKGANNYGELLKANIGFSNDFRSQSPDRWWEALSYMIHSLWGGVTAAAAQITGEKLGDVALVQAAYRATNAVLYMYDANASTTDRKLQHGEAASTYSIAGPNLNRPDLSRNRFGQSIFASDGGIFSRLFPDGYTGEDDWDMGEELVAYLNGFGQTTYLYSDKAGQYHAINGAVQKKDDHQYQVRSFAPYLRKYVNLDTSSRFYTTKLAVRFDGKTQEFQD